ncbi:leucine-rich repeat domain-containing protein, partial [Tannerella forsythia]
MNQVKQLSIWIIALWMAMAAGAATVQAQSVNMSRYITLTVQSGQPINLIFAAEAASTPVRIVSGANTTDIIVGSTKTNQTFTSDGTTMTVYGDIISFDCATNETNLTAIDLVHNTLLKELFCYRNALTVLDVTSCTQLKILQCSANRLTTLDVSTCTQLESLGCGKNQLTSLNISGCGQLSELRVSENLLSRLDISTCTRLKELWCTNNQFTTLDVSACTQLKELYCNSNLLTDIDLRACNQLKKFACFNNQLTSLDVSVCNHLEVLGCDNNQLTSLDVSANTQLKSLYCAGNRLSDLDISSNPQLTELRYDNNTLSISSLNRIYCSLPNRTGLTPHGKIYPAWNGTDPGHAAVLASSGSIAAAKNWKLIYGADDSDIPTTGMETCGSSSITLSPATLTFVAAGEMKPITVTASGAWTAVSNQPWLTLSAGSGTGNGSVDATAAAYTGTTPRTAKVTFTAGSITREVNVTQQAGTASATLTVTPATLDFTFAGETKPVTVTASEAWTAQCDAPWITLSALSGTGNGTITVTAPAYEYEWPRTAKIFFVSGALKDTVTVTQHPKPGPKFLALDYTELTLPVGASQRLVVTAYPKDADINRGVKWYSLNDDI